jgi:hypothetical protein
MPFSNLYWSSRSDNLTVKIIQNIQPVPSQDCAASFTVLGKVLSLFLALIIAPPALA